MRAQTNQFPPPPLPGAEYYRYRVENGTPKLVTLSGREPRDPKRNGASYEEVINAEREQCAGIVAYLHPGKKEFYPYPADDNPVRAEASATTAPAKQHDWHAHRVVVFDGSYDTHIKDGKDYDTLTLREVFDAEPAYRAKLYAPAMIPSSYAKFDARNHEAQRQRGRYVALTADIDKGNLALDAVRSVVREFIGDEVALLIYSSSSAAVDDKKWRIVIPVAEGYPFTAWRELQEAFFGFIEGNGMPVDWSLSRAGQPVYLPNVPGDKRNPKDGSPLFHERDCFDGRGLTAADGAVAQALADLRGALARDEAERQQAQRDAKQAMQARGRTTKSAVIDAFNQAYSIESMLEENRYEPGPRDSWRSPYQASKTFATKNFGDYWVSLSESDAAAGLGAACSSGRHGDAFDIYCHFNHGGDVKKAVREAAKLLGLDRAPVPAVDTSGIMAQVAAAASAPAPVGEANKSEWLGTRPGFEFVPAGDLVREPKPVEYLVDELVEHPSLMMLFGAPSAGKSFVAISMAACIATGHPWLERDVRQGTVFYLAGEGHAGISRRLRAWEIDTGISLAGAPLFVSKLPAALMDAQNAAMVEQAINALSATHGTPVLIVIDTLARNMGSGDESSNADIGQFVAHIDAMRHRLGCTVEIVHHSGHLETDRSRGASALPAAMDAIFQMDNKSGVRSLVQKKAKEAEVAAPMSLMLREVPIGWEDAKGREMTSAVIVKAEGQEPSTPKSKSLTARQQEAMQAFFRAVVQSPLAEQVGNEVGIHVENWRIEFNRTCTAENVEAKRKAFKRVRDDLVQRGCLRVDFETYFVRDDEPGLIAHRMTTQMDKAGRGT